MDNHIYEICEHAMVELQNNSSSLFSLFATREIQESVHGIYESIRENKYPWNKIPEVDVSEAMSKYDDYYKGLVEYVEKVLSLTEGNEIDESTLLDALKRVSQKDEDFRKSLFDESMVSDVDINTAMKNVEYMPHIAECVTLMTDDVEKLKFKSRSVPQKYLNVAEKAIQIQLDSMNGIMNAVMECVKNSFDEIQTSMKHRAPAIAKKEIAEYAIF